MRSSLGTVSRRPWLSRRSLRLAPAQFACLATLFLRGFGPVLAAPSPASSPAPSQPPTAASAAAPVAGVRDCDIAGIIWSVRSVAGVGVEPSQGTPVRAIPKLPLCPGDRFRWQESDAEVWAQVHGVRDVRFSPGSSTDRVPARTLGLRVPADGPLYAAAVSLASRAARAENSSRSRPRSDRPDAPVPRAVAFLPDGPQFIDASTRRIAVVWRAAPAEARLSLDGQVTARTDTGLRWWARFPIDPAAGPHLVELNDRPSPRWAIRQASPAPAPPWMADDGPRSDAQRMVRALWILRSDQRAWKLFAISEIAALADDGHFLALQLWRAVLSGEIEELLR